MSTSPETPQTQAELQTHLIERLQENRDLSRKLGLHVGRNVFFGELDRGEPFDKALDLGMTMAIEWRNYFDDIASTGLIPPESSAEDGCPETLAEVEASERSGYEPSDGRKKLAKFVLRQEVRTKRHVLPVSVKRVKQLVKDAEAEQSKQNIDT